MYKVCEVEKLETTTNQVIKKLKRHSLNSYRAIKELVWKSLFTGWDEVCKTRTTVAETLAFTEDFKEGVRAYAEKRRPNFSGK